VKGTLVTIFLLAVGATIAAVTVVPWNRRWTTNTFTTSWSDGQTQSPPAIGPDPSGPYTDIAYGWRWIAPNVAPKDWTDTFPGGHKLISTLPTNQQSSIAWLLVALELAVIWAMTVGLFIYFRYAEG
jgi:hypothetical protein